MLIRNLKRNKYFLIAAIVANLLTVLLAPDLHATGASLNLRVVKPDCQVERMLIGEYYYDIFTPAGCEESHIPPETPKDLQEPAPSHGNVKSNYKPYDNLMPLMSLERIILTDIPKRTLSMDSITPASHKTFLDTIINSILLITLIGISIGVYYAYRRVPVSKSR